MNPKGPHNRVRNKAIQVWAKFPVAVRAVLMGFVVLLAGILPWTFLVEANLTVIPTIPWAFFVELVYLLLLGQYLRGKGWPASTSQARRSYLRAHRVSRHRLAWSVTAGGLFVSSLIGLQVVGWMLQGFPPSRLEEFALLASYPVWTVVPLLVMGSIVAGFVEEAAFRGYMQVPMEQQYGPTIAIGLVAAIFSLAHFPSPLALPGFVLSAVGWGGLAHLADSILPGVVLHAATDAAVWLWVLLNLESLERTFAASALRDNLGWPLAGAVALTLALGVVALLAFRRLARAR